MILRGGGLSNFVWTDNFFFGMGSVGKFIFMWHGLGKIYFRVNMVNHSPRRQLITRNSNVIESSNIRWNYLDKSSFDLATLCITTNLRHYTRLLKKHEKPTSNNLISNHEATVNKDIFYPKPLPNGY